MAISNFIPTLWSAGVFTSFQANQVVIPTVNREYEGTATAGNTVRIIGAVTPTITDYKGAGRTISAEALSDSKVDLLIDQEKAFSFKVDDVDRAQAAGNFDAWTRAAGGALAEDAEAYVIAKLLSEAGTNLNTGGSAVAVDSGDKAKAALRAIRLQLTKNKVPVADRFVAVNPAMADLLVAGLSDASMAGTDAELRNGVVGRLYGLTIVESPLFAEATKPVAVGYHSNVISFVSQVEETESLRDPASFSDIVRGLHVYGAKVTRAAGVTKYISA
ncbi:MAG TPA: hypothetical protein VK149_04365 [Sideroxyarcus sp.]|nr:hypothetical protein [Sideroxyarcus sp.]